ncbi:uncharacterized protein L3040_007404 [Drepanopeziza brunnea f. sp. 'multigermtubi']|uniref:MNNG and nitrosoguanidine resistance protein n=1 Tax=Marssonina brunnea f. sp. multigermtubi (strain MB_m1) TaxID=1072389 RepID=K1X070_MARBU|nr:MNNG and nitrosoguanidine resistance protein [Drepanopeziza brunnea f. sp. 'multigermtubi' MB_m1]EKD18576.1 MNNG and nitrosoguanidine resistance protein [Drepanopeziza brunnea f. sp. 'multigermtubi' MB_m1]KAJ5037227.1 hypothetical protein L3040_007404 [Drepanopeziza brunnea f. sp. 'multigermtubi']
MAGAKENLSGHSGAHAGPFEDTEWPLMERSLPGLWSPYMATERKTWAKMFIIFVVLLSAIVMGILSIYWGADHSLQFNVPAFTVAVIDFDKGEVGPYIQNMAAEARAANPAKTLGYVSEPGEKYNYSNEQTLRALKQEEYWFGIVVQANATTAMNYAYETGNSSYDPTGAVHLIYEEGRSSLTIATLAYPPILSFLNSFVLQFAKQKQESLRRANAGNAAALARQAENPIPIAFSIYNTAPYIPSTAEASTEIGTIYLIIVSFISVLMFNALNEAMIGKIPIARWVLYRMTILPLLYLFLSLLYLALSCVWQIDLGKFFGAAGYAIYWLLSWIAMMAFGLAVENVNNVCGQPWTPVFFVFWVISNVATGFYPTELLSSFYRWGLAWPLRHDLIGAKALIFGTKNVLGLNFGVLLAWVGVSIALQPLTLWLQRRRLRAQADSHAREVLERVYQGSNSEGGGRE